YAFAVVLDVHGDVRRVRRAGRDRYPAPSALGRLRGVGDEVQQHLVDLRRRAGDGRHLAEVLLHLDRLQEVPGDDERALDAVGDGELVDLAAIQAREILQVADDLGDLRDAVLAVLDQLGELGRRIVRAEAAHDVR